MSSSSNGSGKVYLPVLLRNRFSDWRARRPSELIDHIVRTHHSFLHQELLMLSRFVTGMFRVHGDTHPELAELHIRFHQMKDEIEHHMIAEEEAIFPQIRRAELAGIRDGSLETVYAIEELETEHDEVIAMLRIIRDITLEYPIPEESNLTYNLTFGRLEKLESALFEHIHLESDLLFPKYRNICGA